MMPNKTAALIILLLLCACAQTALHPSPATADTTATVVEDQMQPAEAAVQTTTPLSTQTVNKNVTATPDTRPELSQWRYWPVTPRVSSRAIEIYQRGIEMGNDPHAFSVIGDCQSEPAVFFGIYDTEDRYKLAPDDRYLQRTITQFSGSFGRQGAAVANGLSVSSVFSPLWATHESCRGGETPLECEFRVHKPSIVIVSLGTNWKPGAEIAYAGHFRRIIDFSIARGVLPIIATKADNVEQDQKLNEAMAALAYEYDLPLWNFWLATKDMPDHGIDTSTERGQVYLTTEAWDVKSFTGLRTLDQVWMAASSGQPVE